MRKVFGVRCVGAEHDFASFEDFVSLPIGSGLDRHLAVELLGTKMDMITPFAEMLKLAHQQISPRLVQPNL